LESRLADLRAAAETVAILGVKRETDMDRSASVIQGIIKAAPDKILAVASTVVLEDVLRWAEEIN